MAAGEDATKGTGGETPRPSARPTKAKPANDAVLKALAEVEKTLARLKQVRAERAEAEARHKAELVERDAREKAMVAERDESAAALAEATALATSLTADKDAAQAANAGLGDRVAALETELGAARQERASLAHAAAHAEQLRDELAEVRRIVEEKIREAGESSRNAEILAAKVAEQESIVRELRGSLEAANSQIAAHESGHESAAARVGELTGELQAARAEIERLRADIEAAVQAAAEAEAAARSGADDQALHAAEFARLGAELTQANAQIEELSRGCDADAALREELKTLRAQLTEAQAAREALAGAAEDAGPVLEAQHGEIAELRAKLDAAAEQLLALQADLAERDRLMEADGDGGEGDLIAQLRDELAQARAQCRSHHSRSGSEQGDDGGADPRRLALRHQRLRRVRGALRERAQQFDRAASLLADRVKLCDELLARRRELADAREIVERTHRKVVGGRARSSAAAVVFFGIGLLMVLAGASWAVVSHFYPATYAASAVLAADFRGVTPQPGEPEAWEAFHEQILLDPQLMSRVAERMRQRGFEQLSVPAVLKVKLDQDLSWTAPEPGKLALELRGVGREATARMLDVYSTTLEVEANALRQRRSDSAQTIIAERARAGNEPIVDHRPTRAAVGLAVAALAAMLLWVGIWRRMVNSKQAFESATGIDHLLEESRWVDPIQQIIEARAPAPRAEGKAA